MGSAGCRAARLKSQSAMLAGCHRIGAVICSLPGRRSARELGGIRSERRLCEEVHLNLAYRWFCGLGLDGEVPDHSTFSKNRNGRFRDSDLLRRLFETVLQRCIDEGLVGGEGFAVDASLIQADASDRTRVEGAAGLPPDAAGRAVEEYLAVLDDAAFGAATEVTPKFIAPADPATRWTAAHRGPAFYSNNYLID